ncbi:hypothetical protein D3C75_1232070 [compost metagenome]
MLDQLEGMGNNTLIPGHGSVVGSDYLMHLKKYIQDLIEISKLGLERSEAAFDPRQVAMPSDYAQWGAPDVFYRNLEFLKQFYEAH